MKGIVKAIIAGTVFIVIGAAIIVAVLAANGWKLRTDYEMQTYVSTSDIGSLDLEINAGALKVEYYDGENVVIDYPSYKGGTYKITENNGVLKLDNDIKWYASFFNWNIPETVIKLPEGKVYNLTLDVSAGNVNIAGGSFDKLSLDVSAGNVSIKGGTQCSVLDCDVSAGNISISTLTCPNVNLDVSAGKISVNLVGSKAEYTILTSVSAGSCNVRSQQGTTDKKITADVSAGSVSVTFSN